MTDDAGLIAALRSGDESALGPLYERDADVVYGAAHGITGSQADAEDVLQDVFVGLPEALRRYRLVRTAVVLAPRRRRWHGAHGIAVAMAAPRRNA